MGISKLPLLPSNYPLFDWNDWPKSKAALVKDGPTRNFEKACWNAIVDSLANALKTARIAFYESPLELTVDDIKMLTGVYGILTAQRFNTLREAIDDVIPFLWAWAIDKNFRGYVGRPNHYTGSTVYPEYIIEIVRRVNLVIELLRGTAPVMDVPVYIANNIRSNPGLRVGKAVRIGRKILVYTQHCVEGQKKISAPIFSEVVKLFSLQDVTLRSCKSASISNWMKAVSPVMTRGEIRLACPLKCKDTVSHSGCYMDLECHLIAGATPSPITVCTSWSAELMKAPVVHPMVEMVVRSRSFATAEKLSALSIYSQLAVPSVGICEIKKSKVQTVSLQCVFTSRTGVSADATKKMTTACQADLYSRIDAEPDIGKAIQGSTSCLSMTTLDTKAEKGSAVPCGSEYIAHLSAKISYVKTSSAPCWVEKNCRCQIRPVIDMDQSVNMGAAMRSTTLSSCTLGTAWEPPIWKDGGLWIRQVKRYKVKPDGSLDLSGSGDPIAAVHSGMTVITCALETLWQPPVWHEGGLLIRQVREVKVREDGSLDLSGAGEEFKGRQISRTAVSCALDTAWLPPVMINGGLYIRQAQVAVQNEIGELEVR